MIGFTLHPLPMKNAEHLLGVVVSAFVDGKL
jgi:hypothetical protein